MECMKSRLVLGQKYYKKAKGLIIDNSLKYFDNLQDMFRYTYAIFSCRTSVQPEYLQL